VTPATQIFAYDPHPEARKAMAEMGVQVLKSNVEVVKAATIVVLAVKPDMMNAVLEDIKNAVGAVSPSHCSPAPLGSIPSCSLSSSDPLFHHTFHPHTRPRGHPRRVGRRRHDAQGD
jgi:hypothetical protein